MNIFGFIGLMRSIYGKKLPDLERIQKKGLLAVKIAQHYALRIDFLDQAVCRHLARLYRNTLSIPAEDVDRLIAAGTEPGWLDNFKEFDRTPFASASVGQAHMGILHDGTRVVVKLVKRDFSASFMRDVRALRRLLKVAIFFYPRLKKVFDPLGILEYIEDYTVREMDLENEAAGQDTLKAIFDEYKDRFSFQRLRFPRIYRELSGKHVMVSEFVEGDTFDELLEQGGLSYRQLLDLFNIHGSYMFGPGTFHGDIHPGNVILDKDNYIVFIDTGAVSTVDERIRSGLFGFFEVLATDNYREAARALTRMSLVELTGNQYLRYEERFLDLYKDFKGSTVSRISLTKRMMETIKLGVHSGMRFGKGMFGIIKSLMYLDGMVLRCNPDAVLMHDVGRFIGDFRKILKPCPP